MHASQGQDSGSGGGEPGYQRQARVVTAGKLGRGRADLMTPLIEGLDADRPSLRVGMLAAQLLGFAVARYLLRLDGLAECSPEEAVAVLGVSMQRLCTDPL
jgi:hypothetical protein